ncbi:MAG: class I SAM-dependent methyltransferase [Tepidisphaeraceae bacterium]
MHSPQPITSPVDPTQRFSDRVGFYVRSRPKYPKGILKFLGEELGFDARDRVADVGSGTGFLSELFVQNGNPVFAVEPNANMRAAAEEMLGKFPNFHSTSGKAEETGLDSASVDWVVAGQAFHWFDRVRCRAEFQRILKPDGWVGLVWNHRRTDQEFERAYDRIVEEFQTDLKHVSHRTITATDSEEMAKFFRPAGFKTKMFENPQTLDLEGLIARAMSSSYLPMPGNPKCEPMVRRLQEIFAQFSQGGVVLQNYDTLLFYGQLL